MSQIGKMTASQDLAGHLGYAALAFDHSTYGESEGWPRSDEDPFAKKLYLTDRNKDPNWRNEMLLWSYDTMIQFSALDTADLLTPTPLVLIAGSKAETLGQSERLYQRAHNVKELHVIDGSTYFDFYDIPQYVDPAITKIERVLHQTSLAQTRRRYQRRDCANANRSLESLIYGLVFTFKGVTLGR